MMNYTKEQVEKAETLVYITIQNGLISREEMKVIFAGEVKNSNGIYRIRAKGASGRKNLSLEDLGKVSNFTGVDSIICLPEDADAIVASCRKAEIEKRKALIELLQKEIALLSAE